MCVVMFWKKREKKSLTAITDRVLNPRIRSFGQISIKSTAESVPVKMTQELHTNNVVS